MGFSELIMGWYQENKRPLPWRGVADPYNIWLSEIILQQTRVVQGLPYYLRFIETYPTVSHLAKAPLQEVLKLWQGLGYYSRARNLHNTAIYITNELNGVFPQTYKGLLTLKGIGEYTASAIASICFSEPCAVIDGNVYRVLARYFGIEIPINSGEGKKYFKALAQQLLYQQEPATYNQAIMEFGAVQCKPQSPRCNVCPLEQTCQALQYNRVESLPVKLRKGVIKNRFFNYLVITNGQQVLLTQRTESDIWQNLYEFPLIETMGNISAKKVKTHSLFTQLLQKKPFKMHLYNKKPIIHKLSHQHIHARFWQVSVQDALENAIPLAEMKKYPVSVLIANFVAHYSL